MLNALSGKIAAFLKQPTAQAADVSDLLAAARQDATDARRLSDEARQRALDPTLTEKEADAAFAASQRAAFAADRLDAGVIALAERLEAAMAQEAAAARLAAYNDAKNARNRTVDKIRKRYPALANELAELAEEICTVSDLVAKANENLPEGAARLEPPEDMARGFKAAGFDDSGFGLVNTPVHGAVALRIPRYLALPHPSRPKEMLWDSGSTLPSGYVFQKSRFNSSPEGDAGT
ncbi:hypothetical protein [Gemmobacter caeruleus]|uniref:hypothetical protein n=1 Tax=Gemmobacter caeruleus TaxID=2595004 RepID=UPI0011EE1714|nr:hypothetical protein [Gemmobacter caeruleus]